MYYRPYTDGFLLDKTKKKGERVMAEQHEELISPEVRAELIKRWKSGIEGRWEVLDDLSHALNDLAVELMREGFEAHEVDAVLSASSTLRLAIPCVGA